MYTLDKNPSIQLVILNYAVRISISGITLGYALRIFDVKKNYFVVGLVKKNNVHIYSWFHENGSFSVQSFN